MAKEDTKIQAQSKKIELPAERTQFKSLVLSNPNYFGTYSKLGGKIVKAFSGDTSYEQLECLGLNPGSSLLEAVINIKLHSGYGTNGCGAGTTEYVRFFVKDSSGWHDLGLSTVQVFDLAGPLPLSYSVSVDFSETRKFCFTENIVEVRAILSWEWEPTPGDPNFIPVWGNVVNAEVQVAPRLFFEVPLSELIEQKIVSIDPGVLKQLDTSKSLAATELQPLSYGELKNLYAKEKVPQHRFGFEFAQKVTGGPISQGINQLSTSKLNVGSGVLSGEELSSHPGRTAEAEERHDLRADDLCRVQPADARVGSRHPDQAGQWLLRRAVYQGQHRVRRLLCLLRWSVEHAGRGPGAGTRSEGGESEAPHQLCGVPDL